MQEARIEDLQKRVNELTRDNTLLRKSLLEVLGLALEHAPKEMVDLVMNGLIKDSFLSEKIQTTQ